MAGFCAHHFSVSTALFDGGAYLLSIAALPLPPPKEGGYSFTTPMLMQLTSRPMPVCAVARPRTLASRANVHKRAKPAP